MRSNVPFDVAIVEQLEFDPVRYAGFGGALPGEVKLGLRQRDAEHLDVGDAVEIQGKPAPAAAYVEHLHPRLETELGGDMGLLVELRLFDAVRRIGEVAAAILEVGVEEELVEVVADVIVMGDVAQRRRLPVERPQQVSEPAALAQEWIGSFAVFPAMAAANDVDEVEDLALFDDQPAVHEGFGGTQSGVADDIAGDAGIGQPHRDGAESAVGRAVAIIRAVMVDEPDLAGFDVVSQRLVEQPHARSPLSPAAVKNARRRRSSRPGPTPSRAAASRRRACNRGRSASNRGV